MPTSVWHSCPVEGYSCPAEERVLELGPRDKDVRNMSRFPRLEEHRQKLEVVCRPQEDPRVARVGGRTTNLLLAVVRLNHGVTFFTVVNRASTVT